MDGSSGLQPKKIELNYSINIHLIYNQSMQADILTIPDNFNALQMTRYTMTYDSVPKSLFEKFVHQKYLDHSTCESVRIKDTPDGNG